MKEDKSKKIDGKQVRVLMSHEMLEEIDKFVCLIPNMKRTQLISNLVLMGLDDVRVLNNLGLLKASRIARAILSGAAEVLKEEVKV